MAVLAKTYKKNGGGVQTDSGQALMEMLRGQTMEQAKKNLAKVGVKGDAAGNLLAAANNANMLAASVNGVAQSSGLLGKVSAAFNKIKTAAMGAWAAIGPVGKAVVLLSAAAGAFYLIMTKHNRELKKQVKLGEEAQEKNDDTYKSLKSTKDSVKSLAQQYNKSGKAIKTHADSVEALADTYTELHKKVNNVTNENSTLSDDDYQDYLSISNQLANTYPELVKGYDSQGNAILNLGNNAEEAASKLKDLYSAQQMNANIELSSNIQDIANGVLAANELIDKTVDKLDKKLEALNLVQENLENRINASASLNGIESAQSNSLWVTPENLINQTGNTGGLINSLVNKQLKGLINVSIDEDPDTGDPTGKFLITWDTDNYDDLTKIHDVLSKYIKDSGMKDFDSLVGQETANQDKINTTIKEQEAQQLKKESNYKSLLSYLNQVLQTNSLFTDLNDDIQSAMASNFSGMDYTGLADFLDSHTGDDDAANQYLYENFIVPIKHMSEEAQDVLSEAIQLNPDEFSLSDYSKKIKETLQKVFPDDQETQDLFSQALGFDSIIKESSQTYDKLEKMWRGAGQEIRKMTGEEAEFVLKAKIDQPEASLQELRLKYAQEKKEIENNPIDIKARPNYDAYQTAKENASQGEHYDNMTSALSDFKEAYEQGKKGTDVYKTYAQYLTTYGTFDDASVEKALEKTERYFTEEPADGMINFMNDLTNTYAKNGKALAELDQATGEYKITIDDFEEAAKQMGMGKDWFLDMFDKAEEYGGTFDFFTTEETGLAKLKSLYQGLSTEQQKLFELQQDGADMSAINAQQDIIDSYTERIQNAEKSLDSYYEGAAERIVAETKAGYSGLDLLLKERNKLNNDSSLSAGEVRSNGGRAAYAKGTASKKQVRALSLAYQKEARLARRAGIDISNPQTIFGNINTNKRQVLKWNNSNLKKYKNAIKSWGDDPNDLKGSISTVYGGSNNFNGLEIAYSPILQTKKGAKLLSRNTVFNYINSLMAAANTRYPNSWTTEQFLALDKKGLKIDGQTIKGLVADVGDTAIQTGEAMHYTGKLGSLNQSYNELYKADPKTAKKIKKQLAKKGKSRAEGSWGEPRNTKALTGELGPEMVVRKNRFFTVGDNGPEFADLQKGDIVFNADQTRELLSRGYTTTRGKALAEGNARWGGAQNGSLQLIRGNSGTGTTAPSSDSTAAEEANTKSY